MDPTANMFTQSAELLLLWIGFGALVGLLAKAILPGKDAGGAFATVLIGIIGSIFGAATFYFFTGVKVSPVSLVGFPTAIVATTVLLLMQRLIYSRANHPVLAVFRSRRAPARRHATIIDE